MMNQTESFRHAQSGSLAMLEMNYQDDELSMVVLLPDARDGLPALEASLTAESVDALIAEALPHKVQLSLPRFELELPLPLAELMQTLGIRRAFDPGQADFSKMLDPRIRPLRIDDAIHKAFVKVDEKGTEAAAATGVEAVPTSGPFSFVADHPFLYLIRDRLTGSILFMGRMEDPTKG